PQPRQAAVRRGELPVGPRRAERCEAGVRDLRAGRQPRRQPGPGGGERARPAGRARGVRGALRPGLSAFPGRRVGEVTRRVRRRPRPLAVGEGPGVSRPPGQDALATRRGPARGRTRERGEVTTEARPRFTCPPAAVSGSLNLTRLPTAPKGPPRCLPRRCRST